MGLVTAAAGLTAACSGGTSSSVAPISAPSQAAASLPAAIATGCIDPSPSQQTTALPDAGGVTGTVTVGPVATPASGCAVSVTVATGADARLTLASRAAGSRRRAAAAEASPLPSPIAQVELSTATTSVNWLAVTFTMPASVPAGSYPASVTTSVDLGDGQTYTTTLNYTLTVGPNGNASLTGINVTLGNYSSGLLSIYPSGTVLPTPAPAATGTPSATPSPNGSATPTPLATETATPQPTATATYRPTPSPTPSVAVDCFSRTALAQCGSYVTSGYYDGPAGYYSPSPSPGTSSSQPLYNASQQGNPEGTVNVPYYWFVGTVTIQLPFFAPGYAQTMVNDCPSTVSVVQSGPENDTYTVTFPANGAQFSLGANGASCLIYAEARSDVDEPSYVMSLEYPGGTIEGVRRR